MPFDLNPPSIHFPLIGNSIAVGIPSLLHIVLAGLSVGFMVLAPIFEWRGRRNQHYTDLSYAMTRFTVLVFSVSTVLAVIMVELLIGLFPVTTMWMWNQFRGPLALAIGGFLLQFAFLYPYYHFWEPIRRRSMTLHITLGAAAALLMLVWVAVLDGMGSYMLTPVSGGSTWANMRNPTWLPLGLHRLFGEFVMVGYVIAAYGVCRLGRQHEGDERGYYVFLTRIGWICGFGALMIQPFTGLLYASWIRQAAPEAYEQIIRGEYQFLAYAQFAFLGLLLVGTHWSVRAVVSRERSSRWLDGAIPTVALMMVLSVGHTALRRALLYLLVALTLWSVVRWLSGPGRPLEAASSPWLRALAVMLALLSILTYVTMGTIRETARRPYTVRALISLQDEAQYPAAGRRQTGERESISAKTDGKQ